MNLFYELHQGIPREGPGNNVSTRKAYELIEKYVSEPAILDIGCGPGMQTIELASLTTGTILATDLNEGFLEELRKNVAVRGLNEKVKVEKADMKALPYKDGQFDVIWAEGAIYIIGFEKGLREWKKYLKDGGILVVSELSWLRENAPQEPADFWANAYPEAGTVQGNREKAENLGYEVIDTFVLPEAGWWEDYYFPLEEKINILQDKYKEDQASQNILKEFQTEIDVYRNYSDYYGYVFYILRKSGGR